MSNDLLHEDIKLDSAFVLLNYSSCAVLGLDRPGEVRNVRHILGLARVDLSLELSDLVGGITIFEREVKCQLGRHTLLLQRASTKLKKQNKV